ncbi:MAG: ubiquinol-cytochrome c reductase iron-sulfur subunit [Candidatus Competibacterales bacterium]
MLSALHTAISPKRALAAQSAAPSAAEERKRSPQVGDGFTYFSKSRRGAPLRVEDLERGGKQLLVVPVARETGVVRDGSRFNQILLQRFDIAELDAATAAISAAGVVAYSAICTHTGCPVSAWDRDSQTYMCPCHQSQFNPKNLGAVTHGPAPRQLPALPLKIEDGTILVAGNFTSRVGFGNQRNRRRSTGFGIPGR